jgi:hypothetical protein
VGGHGDLEVHAHCKPDGLVSLAAVEVSGFRMDWRGSSGPRSMTGRRVFQSSRAGSSTRLHLRTQSPSSPGSMINRRTTTAARKRRTESRTEPWRSALQSVSFIPEERPGIAEGSRCERLRVP